MRVRPIHLVVSACAVFSFTGCATKNYVRNQTAPIIQQTDQLDQKTADNNRAIHDVDSRAQAGIGKAQQSADTAGQNANSAQQAAMGATGAANDAVHRADSLAGVVAGLDNYKQVGDVTVTFAFNKSVLTSDDRAQLDSFAAKLNGASNYILEVTGGTDSIGNPQYNYQLSQRRADAVVQYLASKYHISPRRFYLIGIGEDKAVGDNHTRAGRAMNRRVTVQMLSNMSSNANSGAASGN
jgi:outer membrane protein OmpA-like peptidoglycan-associated protein